MSAVAIIDSGGANIASLRYAFDRLGAKTSLTKDAATIQQASHVVLPGVGAARDAMQRLAEAQLLDLIPALQQPVLGVCLGMQLLCEASEEDNVECLGVIPGIARKLPVSENNPVPNMGWCATRETVGHPLLRGIEDASFFYYIHSFALPPGPHTVATANHTTTFSAVLSKENFMAAQFHPERSSQAGAKLLKNFLSAS